MARQGLTAPNPDTVSVRVPIAFRRRGERKIVMMPEGAPAPSSRPRNNDAAIRALSRAFRWRKLIETGVHQTIQEIADAEKANPSYVSRMLRMTLLAPAIIEAILEQRAASEMTLGDLLKPFPVQWAWQIPDFSGK